MNMIYKDETLFIDLKEDVEITDINIIKQKIFSILDQYNIDNIVLNTNGAFNTNKKLLNSLKRDYKSKYFGSFKIM